MLGVYVDEAFGAFQETLDVAGRKARSPREALIAIGMAYVRFAWKRPAAFRLTFHPQSTGARIDDQNSAVARTYEVLVETVAADRQPKLKSGPLEIQVLAA